MFLLVDTTGRVLAATIGYLAIYQEDQEKAYQEIVSACSTNQELVRHLVTEENVMLLNQLMSLMWLILNLICRLRQNKDKISRSNPLIKEILLNFDFICKSAPISTN